MFPYTYSSSSPLDLEAPNFSHIPWPFLDDIVDDEQHQNLPPPATSATNMLMMSNGGVDGVPVFAQKTKQLPWKRDRHSKIRTAQGLRDRRMRLSVKVAQKFFDLQDKLDFDKASKTIEWLLNNSEPAIKELARTQSYILVSSETNKEAEITMQVTKPRSEKRRRRRGAVSKESRDKARARARDRTRQKIMARGQGIFESTKQLKACRDSAETDPNHNLEFPGFITSNNEAGNEFAILDCYVVTSNKPTLGNVQEKNNPNSQEHTTNGQWNPSLIFGTTPNNNTTQYQNPIPNSIFMNTSALELGNSLLQYSQP